MSKKSNIEDIYTEQFQLVVDEYLDRNRSILDSLTKYNLSTAKCVRAVVKAATQCGCISIAGDDEGESDSCRVTGTLCEKCRERIELEIGEALFYLAAIANAFDISIMDCMLKEKQRLDLLGDFSLK